MGGLALILSTAIFIGVPLIAKIILGSEYKASIPVMGIMAGLPLLLSLSNILGVQVMYSFEMQRAAKAIVFNGGLINLSLAVLFIPVWVENGMALAVVAT